MYYVHKHILQYTTFTYLLTCSHTRTHTHTHTHTHTIITDLDEKVAFSLITS